MENLILVLDEQAYKLLELIKSSDVGLSYEELVEVAKRNRISEPVQVYKRLEGHGLTRLDRLSGGRGYRFKAMPKAFMLEIHVEA